MYRKTRGTKIEKEKVNGLSDEVYLKARREFLNRYEKIDFHKYYLDNPFKESCMALYNLRGLRR